MGKYKLRLKYIKLRKTPNFIIHLDTSTYKYLNVFFLFENFILKYGIAIAYNTLQKFSAFDI